MDSKEKILIYDIECSTAGKLPNAEKDEFKAFGCYSYATDEYYFLTSLDKVKDIISYHDYLVGFNNLYYDNVVLKRYFWNDINVNTDKRFNTPVGFFQHKYNLDLRQIVEKRVKIIMVDGNLLDDVLLRYDLDTVSKTVGVVDEGEGKITDFDYSLLKKPSWAPEDVQKIKEYTLRDIEVTKKLYEWLEEYFESFKDYLSEPNIKAKSYLTCTPSSFAYKAICYQLGLEEEYEEVSGEASYGGGYVAYPAGESFDDAQGDIYLLDFKSLYPHINFQCNLFSPANVGWSGNGVFKTKGTYDNTRMGEVEKFLLATYKKRREFQKDKDPKEYALKIMLNSIYGLSSSKRFKHLYHPFTARDCTSLGRQWVQLARKRFREAGYVNIFSDTDSVCVLDKFRDKQKLLNVKDAIIKEIKDNVPFPSDTFDMSIEAEIKNIWFFKNKSKTPEQDKFMDEDDYSNKKKGLLKKNYIYLTKQDEVKVKNLGVRKKSVSLITRNVFWNVLIPKIKGERKVKFFKTFFVDVINDLLEQDLSLAAIRYSVNAFETYKSESQLQAQIAKKYGPGVHFLIPNNRYGVGKKKFYCSAEEFKEKGLTIHDINLENVWQEFDYFIEEQQLSFEFIQHIASHLLGIAYVSPFLARSYPKLFSKRRKLIEQK